MATCSKCGKSFIPAKYKSTIGCPSCVNNLSNEVKKGLMCKCMACGKEYIAYEGDSIEGCRMCVFGKEEHPSPIQNRFEILDL